MTTDLAAIAHILGNAYDYPKPDFVRDSLASMAAGHDGLLTVEGDVHRRQRRILTPAFSSSHIKSLTPIFWAKASELRDIWLQLASGLSTPESHSQYTNNEATTKSPCAARVDALMWLGRATLDVIGLAGFGYHFNSLTDDDTELANAFRTIFSTARKFRAMTILQTWFPFLRRFRRNNAAMIQAQATMRRIGSNLVEERRNEVVGQQNEVKGEEEKGNTIAGDKTKLRRDLLSVLIRSNITTSVDQRMSVNEIMCQISTFLAAGHETTASALTWCLYALVQNPLAQNKLRDALRAVESSVPVADSDDTSDRHRHKLRNG